MDRALLALIVAAVGIGAAYAGVTGIDPRDVLASTLSGRKREPRRLFPTGVGVEERLRGVVGGTGKETPQLQIILRSLQSAGLLRPGRTCGVDTLAGEATSEHFHCNAKDLSVSSAADGNRIAAYLENGLRSGALPIHCLIWNRRIISRERIGEGWRPYTGANSHTDHVHVSGWPSIGGSC